MIFDEAKISPDTLRFSDQEIVALTLLGEAESMGLNGMQATACTIKNRLNSGVKWWGKTPRQVCLYPWQYSCWNTRGPNPNRFRIIGFDRESPDFKIAMMVAAQVIDGSLKDVTNGATHYYNPSLCQMPNFAKNRNPCFMMPPHLFYRVLD